MERERYVNKNTSCVAYRIWSFVASKKEKKINPKTSKII